MFSKRSISSVALLGAITSLAGCGLAVPELQEPWSAEEGGQQMVRRIVKGVYCEIEDAVDQIMKGDADAIGAEGHGHKLKADWLRKWGAQITLTLTIDEATDINPGATLKQPIAPAFSAFPGVDPARVDQTFNIGLGGHLGARAERVDKINLYFTVEEMLRNRRDNRICIKPKEMRAYGYYYVQPTRQPSQNPMHGDPHSADFQSPILMQSNLGVQKWLSTAIFAEQIASQEFLLNVSDGHPENAIQHEVSFKVVTGASVTPSWNLVRVSAPNDSLLGATRERLHDLLITFGPDRVLAAKGGGRKERPAAGVPGPTGVAGVLAPGGGLEPSAAALHFSSQIGQAINQTLRFR